MEKELYHYGVKGMKWGVRRYQNSDGTLTSEGRKRARKEYKEDNEKAFQLGRQATISGHAAAKSMSRTAKIEDKLKKQYDKDPEGIKRRTQSLRTKWIASAKTTQELVGQYLATKDLAEKHCQSLVDKYGKEAVSSIKYKDARVRKSDHGPSTFRTMNENTNTFSDYAYSVGMTMTSIGISMMAGLPFVMISRPTSTAEKAAMTEYAQYRSNLERQKNVHTAVVTGR